MQRVLRIIRSMFLDFAYRNASSRDLIHLSTLVTSGSLGAPPQMHAFRGPTPRRFDVWKVRRQVAVLSLIAALCSDGRAQSLPTMAVERDGDTFYVNARASVAVDPRIAWETLTDYEHMREFLPNIERSKVVARQGTRLIVEHVGQFPLFFFDIPVRVRLAVTQQPYERIVARSEPGDVDGAAQTLRSFAGSYDLAVITLERRAGIRIEYQSRFELAEPLPPIVGDLFGTAMVTKTLRQQFEAMVQEMVRRQAGRASIERAPTERPQ
jgi:Polyketide cyclase / dehydrase and lipid transport